MPHYDMDYDFGYGYEYRRPMRRSYRGRERYGPENRGWAGAGREWTGYGDEWTSYPPVYRGRGLGYATEYRPSEQRTVGYGREFEKSRWETDYGDPFRDRERGTPIRMMRGEWTGYGEEYRGGGRRGLGLGRWRQGYGREYRFRPRDWRY